MLFIIFGANICPEIILKVRAFVRDVCYNNNTNTSRLALNPPWSTNVCVQHNW